MQQPIDDKLLSGYRFHYVSKSCIGDTETERARTINNGKATLFDLDLFEIVDRLIIEKEFTVKECVIEIKKLIKERLGVMGNEVCENRVICRFKKGNGEECTKEKICNFFEPFMSDEATLTKVENETQQRQKRKKKGKQSLKPISELTTSKEDVARAKLIINDRIKRGKLSDGHRVIYDRLNGVWYKNMNEGDRLSIINIAKTPIAA